ncbi:hypothetical protein DVH24_007579 [Malus domestica]|uniref:RNase H type-1 domain-containing protein n=1 Tax=Malus domestica TaxID=3750 RepID=A0A498HN31_MALDO|nr:hypothetical protein DVH24_007579 [Malus domestica]
MGEIPSVIHGSPIEKPQNRCGRLFERLKDEVHNEEIFQELVYVLWRIWKYRNECVFKGSFITPHHALLLVRNQICEFRLAQPTIVVVESREVLPVMGSSVGQQVRWPRPEFGVLKVNCAGGGFFLHAAMAEAASMLNCMKSEDATLECYLHDIRLLADQIGVVKFLFVRRSGNMAAHKVAAFTALHGGFFSGMLLVHISCLIPLQRM